MQCVLLNLTNVESPNTNVSTFIQTIPFFVDSILYAKAYGFLFVALATCALAWRTDTFFADFKTLANAAMTIYLLASLGHSSMIPILVISLVLLLDKLQTRLSILKEISTMW